MLSQSFLRFLKFCDLCSVNIIDPRYTFLILKLKLCGVCSIGFVVILPSTNPHPENPAGNLIARVNYFHPTTFGRKTLYSNFYSQQ